MPPKKSGLDKLKALQKKQKSETKIKEKGQPLKTYNVKQLNDLNIEEEADREFFSSLLDLNMVVKFNYRKKRKIKH